MIYRELGNEHSIAISLSGLGSVAYALGDYTAAYALNEQCLATSRKLGDKLNIAGSLNYLGKVAKAQGNYKTACALLEESLVMGKELGNKRVIACSLEELASLAVALGDIEGNQTMGGIPGSERSYWLPLTIQRLRRTGS